MNLITGSTGIVGSRILFDLLSRDLPVRALKRADSATNFVSKVFQFLDPIHGIEKFNQINWFEGDLLDTGSIAEALTDVDYVYHTAGLVSYRSADAEKLIQVNGVGTANLVNYCLDAGVKKISHISSIAALGTASNGGLTNEENEWSREQNRSIYGLSKHLAEREVWRGTMEGLPAVILNPTIIIGPSKPDQSSGMLFNLIRKGVKAYPKGMTGFVDVKDVSLAAIQLMESEIENQRFIINGENLSYKELLLKGAEIFIKPAPSIELKPWLLNFAWRASAVIEILGGPKARITRETAKSASNRQCYDCAKLKKTLSYSPTPISTALSNYRLFEA